MVRAGRSLTYDEQQRSEIVKAAKTNAQHLDLEFGHWTLDLLVAYVNQTLGIAISCSQLGEILFQRESRSSVRGKKGAIVSLYRTPPEEA